MSAAPPPQSGFPEARLAGHIVAFLAGAASLSGAVGAFSKGMPGTLGVTMLILGVVLPVLAYFSLQYFSRVAWSFMFSIEIVMAIVTLFGSPKVRNLLHIPLGAALIIPFVLLLGILALGVSANDYRGTPSQKSQNAAR
jgi:hypothetical protein